MKIQGLFVLPIVLVLCGLLIIHTSCKKKSDPVTETQYLGVTFPRLSLKHDLYFSLDHDARSIQLVFSEEVNPEKVAGNISLSDKAGSLQTFYELETSGEIVSIVFHQNYKLYDGWKYMLTITTGLRSISGKSLKENQSIELRTTAKHIHATSGKIGMKNIGSQRNSIACISDIHLGDQRAISGNYCWFGKNAAALDSFLVYIQNHDDVRQLVILGDLFDEWLVPYTVSPFDPQAAIHNSEDYFIAIGQASVNSQIIDKLKIIASNQEIDLLYVPGNHDMLLTQDVLQEIIPGAIWMGDSTGLGKYSPVNEIIMEHGHRYDFFNCPQSLVNPGHMLPPGYFISRLYAAGMATQSEYLEKGVMNTADSAKFWTAWTLAMLYTIGDFHMQVPALDSANVLMGGIDGYSNPFSFNGAQSMYAANIENLWPETQITNDVPVPSSVFAAILNGVNLYGAALLEFMQQSSPLSPYKIVAFGHSHEPMLEVYPPGSDYTSIYANSGSWIDADQSKYEVRTFMVIKPGEWTGSELDVVSLYQYNLESGDPDPVYKPILISEENIEINK